MFTSFTLLHKVKYEEASSQLKQIAGAFHNPSVKVVTVTDKTDTYMIRTDYVVYVHVRFDRLIIVTTSVTFLIDYVDEYENGTEYWSLSVTVKRGENHG